MSGKIALENPDIRAPGCLRKVRERITDPPPHFICTFEERRDLDIEILRRETEADHYNVEAAVSLVHQELNVAEYVRCLQRIYGVVAAWEERAAAMAPEWLQAALLARQRGFLLKQDLTQFGAGEQVDGRPMLPQMNTPPRLLGTMYVMEGSTLGGQFIARHVEGALHLSEGQGSSYFRGHGRQTGAMWKEFCEILKQRIPDEQTAAVVFSAKAMFSTFGMWTKTKSAMDGS